MNPKIILIAGGSCSGKSEFSKSFKNALVIELDRFYLPLDKIPKKNGKANFDSPESVDIAQCAQLISKLRNNESVDIPVYDFVKNDRIGIEHVKLEKDNKFIIVEGIFALYSPLREIADLKIFLDVSTEIRLARRIVRDVTRKQQSEVQIIKDYPDIEENYKKYIESTKTFADIIIPFSSNPLVLQ